jgi:hypothetical protein
MREEQKSNKRPSGHQVKSMVGWKFVAYMRKIEKVRLGSPSILIGKFPLCQAKEHFCWCAKYFIEQFVDRLICRDRDTDFVHTFDACPI